MREHMGMVREMRTSYNDYAFVATDHAQSSGRKPAALRPRVPLASLAPISVADLQLGTTHVGRVLRGKLAAPANVMKGAMTVLEDAHGRLVLLAVYNMLPAGLGMRELHQVADVALAEGASVAVIEPFFKRFADGTCGVRVDDPRDLVHLDAQPDARDAAAWKEEGNVSFRGGQYAEAERCYSAGLGALDEGAARLLSGSLSNLAAALLAQPGAEGATAARALLCASAAAAVDANYAKARFRAASALRKLGDAAHARWCVVQTQRLGGGGAECDELLSALPAAAGAADERSLALALSAFADAAALTTLPQRLGDSKDAATLKARGNEHFAARRFAEAAVDYSAALRLLQTAAATLLCNRSACKLQLDRSEEALVDPIAALTLTPDMAKAHYRRASALLALDKSTEAAAAVALGLKACPQDAVLLELQKRLKASLPSAAAQQEPKPSQTPVLFDEREMQRIKAKESAGVESVAGLNQLLEMLSHLDPAGRAKAEAAGMVLDERIPSFHTEFARAGRWPKGCDVDACSRALWDVYEHSRSIQNMNAMHVMKPSSAASIDAHDLMKRLGTNDERVLRWLLEAPLGSVRDRTGENLQYNPRIWHSFSNSESRAVALTSGRTHVAVGFVDLSVLRDAIYSEKQACPGPLRFVGVEASAYAVAKTAVVDAMLRAGAATDAVLQVWYSAAWSKATLAAFRAAVSDLLQRGGADNAHGATQRQPEVAALLRVWQLRDVPLAAARKQWLSDIDRKWYEIATFTKRADRDALCAYMLTGQLLDAEVGSVCMFVQPPEFPSQRSLDESVFHNIPAQILWRRRRETPDIVAAAVAHLREGIKALAERVAAGKITVELRLHQLSPSSTAEMASISALKPFTMSWSNVSDYVSMRDFHAMARACSGPGGADTIHYGYSMNWPLVVKGASVLDWMLMEPERPEGAKPNPKSPLQLFQKGALAVIDASYAVCGCKPYLLFPPPEDMRNLVDLALFNVPASANVPSFRDKWLDAFFSAARLRDRERQVGAVANAMFSQLSRSSSTVFFIFTYDPDIRMTAKCYK